MRFIPVHHEYHWLLFNLKLLVRLPFLDLPPAGVIQAHQPLFMFPIALADRGHPKICTLGAIPLEVTRLKQPRVLPLIRPAYRLLERLMVHRVDRFIAVSQNIADYYVERYPELASKLDIVPVGVDTDLFKPTPARREAYGLPHDARIVVFVGRLERVKRVDFLLEAFAHIAHRMPEAHLLIVGRGSDEGRVRSLHAERGIPRVHFLGEHPPMAIPEVLSLADVLALCSESEGSPAVVREALACGVPVISTDVGDVRDVLRDARVGRVVDADVRAFAEALLAALHGEAGFDRTRCREVALRFSFLETGHRYLEAVVEVSRARGRFSPPPDARVRLILHAIRPDDRVLDVGCAAHTADAVHRHDWLHRHLVRHAREVVGVDILPEEVERLVAMGFNVRTADAERMRLGERFDVVVAGEIIEHLANPGLFLETVREHLLPSGRLILTTPNAWAYHRTIRAWFREVPCHEDHTCWYDRVTLMQLLQRYHYRVQSLEYIPTPQGARGWVVSHLLSRIGLRQVGGEGLFCVATPSP